MKTIIVRSSVVVAVVAAIFGLWCWGCALAGGVFRLSDGSRVVCAMRTVDRCGVNLYDCDDGKSYLCQVNVTVEDK
jgi:hypothetical protein